MQRHNVARIEVDDLKITSKPNSPLGRDSNIIFSYANFFLRGRRVLFDGVVPLRELSHRRRHRRRLWRQ